MANDQPSVLRSVEKTMEIFSQAIKGHLWKTFQQRRLDISLGMAAVQQKPYKRGDLVEADQAIQAIRGDNRPGGKTIEPPIDTAAKRNVDLRQLETSLFRGTWWRRQSATIVPQFHTTGTWLPSTVH